MNAPLNETRWQIYVKCTICTYECKQKMLIPTFQIFGAKSYDGQKFSNQKKLSTKTVGPFYLWAVAAHRGRKRLQQKNNKILVFQFFYRASQLVIQALHAECLKPDNRRLTYVEKTEMGASCKKLHGRGIKICAPPRSWGFLVY